MTSSMRYLDAPGNTRPESLEITIKTSPKEMIPLLGQTIVLNTWEMEILFLLILDCFNNRATLSNDMGYDILVSLGGNLSTLIL